MNVYVESNFVLEMALDQEDCEPCQQVLGYAMAGKIRLVLPAYALLEPAETLTRRIRGWEQLSRDVETELKQLRRSSAHQKDADALAGLTLTAVKLATDRHEKVRADLLSHAQVIPIDRETLVEAERLRATYGMTLADATMLAAVLRHDEFGRAPSVFINKNGKDFADPGIRQELTNGNCKFIGNFPKGLQYIESTLS